MFSSIAADEDLQTETVDIRIKRIDGGCRGNADKVQPI